jgi:hypothetical protein
MGEAQATAYVVALRRETEHEPRRRYDHAGVEPSVAGNYGNRRQPANQEKPSATRPVAREVRNVLLGARAAVDHP